MSKIPETIAQKAYRLLKGVPDNKWTDSFLNNGKCCALGHYNRLTSGTPKKYEYSNCRYGEGTDYLTEETKDFLLKYHSLNSNIMCVNDENTVNGYTQKKMKARVLSLLKDMTKAGY